MRKLAAFAIPFSAAIFAAVYLLPAAVLIPAALLCALSALSGLIWKGERRLLAILIPIGLAAGLLWTSAYHAIFYEPARVLDLQTVDTAATVLDWPVSSAYGVTVTVKLRPEHGPAIKTQLFADLKYKNLAPGDEIHFNAQLRLSNSSHGEETDYYRAKGVFLFAYARGDLIVVTPEHTPIWCYPAHISKALRESIAACFDGTTAPLITALVTGDKSGLPGDLYAAFRRTGLAHVVAVSGLHISFLAGLVAVLLGKNNRRSALIGILVLLGFAGVAGNTASVLRAVFLQSALLIAPLVGRQNDNITTLSAALMLILTANPYSAASISLQLSFAAVAGIYLLTGSLQHRWTGWLPQKPDRFLIKLGCKLFRFLAATLATTAGALIFTTPLMAVYFKSLSLIAPLANLLGLWAASDAFLGGLITGLAGLLSQPLGELLALIAALPAHFLLWLTPLLARFPFAAVPLSSLYLKLWLLLVYVIVALFLLWRGQKQKRPIFPLCACGATLCAAIFCTALAQTGGSLVVTALDVGQGQSVALWSQGKLALVDCGGNGMNDPGDVAADYIQSLGLNRVDLLVLTHFHTDHAGGVPELFARLDIGALVMPAVEPADPMRQELERLAAKQGTQIYYITDDATITFGTAALRIYAPLGDGGANEAGLSVLCTSGDFDALITGDMNAAVERRLVKYGDLPDVELLLAGHHGSDYATSQLLLDAVKPEYAIISVGYNTYGHPAPGTLSRLAQTGCEIYRTDWMGHITVTAR